MAHQREDLPTRHVVGVMSGTSLDGLDAVVLEIVGRGLSMRATLLRHHAAPLEGVADRLRRLAEQMPMTGREIAALACDLGLRYAEVIAAALDDGKGHAPDLIAAHGQTVFHQPPHSWQLLNPAPIAQRYRCPVVYDLRQADLAAGGEGAPITPLADWIMFRHAAQARAIVNLGGFCNTTILPRAGHKEEAAAQGITGIRGFDVCACNQVLDGVARLALDRPFDENGAQAAQGTSNVDAVESLVALLRGQRCGERSLGTGDEAAQWVRAWCESVSGRDLAASAVEAVARAISEALAASNVDEVILAGGGALNRTLIVRLRQHVVPPIRLSDELGVPVQAREAMAMAILGALSADGVPITLPQITGCESPPPVAGLWTACGQESTTESAESQSDRS